MSCRFCATSGRLVAARFTPRRLMWDQITPPNAQKNKKKEKKKKRSQLAGTKGHVNAVDYLDKGTGWKCTSSEQKRVHYRCCSNHQWRKQEVHHNNPPAFVQCIICLYAASPTYHTTVTSTCNYKEVGNVLQNSILPQHIHSYIYVQKETLRGKC